MKRPFGIALLSALAISGGLLQFAVSLVELNVDLADSPPLASKPETVLYMLPTLVWSVCMAMAGIGLWSLRKWGRYFVIFLSLAVIVPQLTIFLVYGRNHPAFHNFADLVKYLWHPLLWLTFCGSAFGYMFTRKVRLAFSAQSEEANSASGN